MGYSQKCQRGEFFRLLILATMACIFAGCATSGKPFLAATPPEDRGLIYVYRPPEGTSIGSGNSYYLSANGIRLCTLSHRVYFPYEARPGNTTFSYKTKAGLNLLGFGLIFGVASHLMERDHELITINVDPGEVYFVRFQASGSEGPRMEIVNKDIGESEIRNLTMAEKYE